MTTNVSELQTSGPRTRTDLDVNEVPDGLIIYDGESDRVHYLNHTAALIFCLCTGEYSEAAIAQEVEQAFSLDRLPAPETESCLADFRREGLLV
jgi:Coenzyme PQQ synthesis protein D (PqqD)